MFNLLACCPAYVAQASPLLTVPVCCLNDRDLTLMCSRTFLSEHLALHAPQMLLVHPSLYWQSSLMQALCWYWLQGKLRDVKSLGHWLFVSTRLAKFRNLRGANNVAWHHAHPNALFHSGIYIKLTIQITLVAVSVKCYKTLRSVIFWIVKSDIKPIYFHTCYKSVHTCPPSKPAS